MNKCPFCAWKTRKGNVLETKFFVLTKNMFPIIDSHHLLITKKHVLTEDNFTRDMWIDYRVACKKTHSFIKKQFKDPLVFINPPHQQSVPHFHRHYLAGVFGVHGVANALKNYLRKK